MKAVSTAPTVVTCVASTADPVLKVAENLIRPPSVPASPESDKAVTTQSLKPISIAEIGEIIAMDKSVPTCPVEPDPTL